MLLNKATAWPSDSSASGWAQAIAGWTASWEVARRRVLLHAGGDHGDGDQGTRSAQPIDGTSRGSRDG
ncbi:hypothetical protein [Streptomyces celluloflavus]|uniref:Uncharacterized protein n=1 Tax=Streptomyces celluloflavus TaxID=58344 RepID=A0ABW7R7M7_9ACTN|nr:hypothetical protein OG717_16025 [Streptomyces celluloflavus]